MCVEKLFCKKMAFTSFQIKKRWIGYYILSVTFLDLFPTLIVVENLESNSEETLQLQRLANVNDTTLNNQTNGKSDCDIVGTKSSRTTKLYLVLSSCIISIVTSALLFGMVYISKEWQNIRPKWIFVSNTPKNFNIGLCLIPIIIHDLFMFCLSVYQNVKPCHKKYYHNVDVILISIVLILSIVVFCFVCKCETKILKPQADNELKIASSLGNFALGLRDNTCIQDSKLQGVDSKVEKNIATENETTDSVSKHPEKMKKEISAKIVIRVVPVTSESKTEKLETQTQGQVEREPSVTVPEEQINSEVDDLELWRQSFANSVLEDLAVKYNRVLRSVAGSNGIHLYDGTGPEYERKCKEHYVTLKPIVYEIAYKCMHMWQSHGNAFKLEEMRSLLLQVATKWMTVIHSHIAKGEEGVLEPYSNEIVLSITEDEKNWFKRAMAFEKDLNISGLEGGPANSLLYDKWMMVGKSYGNIGLKTMKFLALG